MTYGSPIATADRPYHHGDLRRALLDEALTAVDDFGPSGWSMRELTRRIGVSNAASSRHFRDKRALLTALALEGWTTLGDRLTEAWGRRQAFSDVGKAYVRFATEDTPLFEVVCRPELYDPDDPAVALQRDRVFAVVTHAMAVMGEPEPLEAGVAAWSLVHGLAVLHLSGLLPDGMDDPIDGFLRTSKYMFQRPPPAP